DRLAIDVAAALDEAGGVDSVELLGVGGLRRRAEEGRRVEAVELLRVGRLRSLAEERRGVLEEGAGRKAAERVRVPRAARARDGAEPGLVDLAAGDAVRLQPVPGDRALPDVLPVQLERGVART